MNFCLRMTLIVFLSCLMWLLMSTFSRIDAKIKIYDNHNQLAETYTNREDFYGGDIVPTKGLIVMANPINACSPIQDAQNFSNFSSFVLIFGNYSDCTAGVKIINAMSAGFDLAILVDPLYLHFNRTKNLQARVGDIPVIFIKPEIGNKIASKYLFKNQTNYFWLEVTPNIADMTYYILMFSIIIGISFAVMVLFMICLLVKCCRERRRTRRNRLSTRQIRQLPTENYNAEDHSNHDQCAICLENYKEGEKLRVLPCQHVYHTKCVDPWLQNNNRTCPLCKRKVRIGNSDDDTSSCDSSSQNSTTTERTPLILPHGENPISDYRHLLEVLSAEITQFLYDNNDNGVENPALNAEENLDDNHHPSTFGSVNNSESEEFVDALTPHETDTSVEV